jgi:hypothetical protein
MRKPTSFRKPLMKVTKISIMITVLTSALTFIRMYKFDGRISCTGHGGGSPLCSHQEEACRQDYAATLGRENNENEPAFFQPTRARRSIDYIDSSRSKVCPHFVLQRLNLCDPFTQPKHAYFRRAAVGNVEKKRFTVWKRQHGSLYEQHKTLTERISHAMKGLRGEGDITHVHSLPDDPWVVRAQSGFVRF